MPRPATVGDRIGRGGPPAVEQTGRCHEGRDARLGQVVHQEARRHRRPVDVGRADEEHPGSADALTVERPAAARRTRARLARPH